MTVTLIGAVEKQLSVDDEGGRTHTVTYHVKTTTRTEGPIAVYTCAGLPQIGELYNVDSEVDLEAYCAGPTGTIKLVSADSSARLWAVPVVWKTGGSPTNKSSANPDQHLAVDSDNWVISGDS